MLQICNVVAYPLMNIEWSVTLCVFAKCQTKRFFCCIFVAGQPGTSQPVTSQPVTRLIASEINVLVIQFNSQIDFFGFA